MAATDTLKSSAIQWAIKSSIKNADGDICPHIIELEALASMHKEYAILLQSSNVISEHSYGSHRRFVVPKSLYSYRLATQLYPQDSIILTSIIKQFGGKIEKRRLSKEHVFSYRFRPTLKYNLYDDSHSWNNFWRKASEHSSSHKYALYMDISDFYNQINHHDIENQLNESQMPSNYVKWIIGLFGQATGNISRGVPIGPHATHLIAEATLIPFDEAMINNGYTYIRYVDDIIIFCQDANEAQSITANVVDTLDRHHKLTLQNNKTRIFKKSEFRRYCTSMIDDRPINNEEREIINIIRRYSNGNPYLSRLRKKITTQDWQALTDSNINTILSSYLRCKNIDYLRLAWFYRRLSQTGHPGALLYTLKNINKLLPCFSSICNYILSISDIERREWIEIGKRLYKLLDRPEINKIPFYKISILSLFSQNKNVNHFHEISSRFHDGDSFIKRELLLAARINGVASWIQERKQDFQSMNDWERLAMIYSASILPKDAKKFYLKQIKHKLVNPLEQIVWQWSNK